MMLWPSAWLFSWLPSWMPPESIYLVGLALALVLVNLLAWLWSHWRTHREWIAGRQEYERRMGLERKRREIQAYRQRTAEATRREAVSARQSPADRWRQADQHALDAFRRDHPRERIPDEEFWPWYRAYLQSDLWKARRHQTLQRDGGLCRICRTAPAQEVHHLTYARAGDEDPDDLISVCGPCHQAQHARPPHPLYAWMAFEKQAG